MRIPIYEQSKTKSLHFIVVIGFVTWTGILTALYFWFIDAELEHHDKLIALKAEALGQQTQILRRWIGGHGDVYVEIAADIQPQTQLAHIKEREIETHSGRKLNLLHSPTVLRKILKEFGTTSNDQIRLIAYNPINPSGKPDTWEKESLDHLQNGSKKVQADIKTDTENVFRLMYPIKRQKKCDRCHDYAADDTSEVVGGLSIIVDRAPHDAQYQALKRRTRLTYFWIWLAGTLGLLLFDLTGTRLLRKIEYTSTHDPLTQLNNRGRIERELHREIERANRYNAPFSIFLLDIDHFKEVNDTYGHSAGDDALKAIAQTLKDAIRKTDSAGRYGGEEFIILVPNTDEENSIILAERILHTIQKTPVTVSAGKTIFLTASIGVSSLATAEGDAQRLVNNADKALYKAKNTGRNRICIANT